ncbi:MAG: biotin--[acetyl-CoA-carboxylase] ligase, partial [Dysosmobacter sp.]|nr:biotin--[acetyl-CoA-carboxylase] ligase [Dysosmobacter sp.]
MTSLRESAIRRALAGDCLVGREVRVLPEVGSTNDYLKEAAREGAPEGLAVLAERQTAGKGRL